MKNTPTKKNTSKKTKTKSIDDIVEGTNSGNKLKALYLGEVAFGTKAYDPLAMIGLTYYLKKSKNTDLDCVIIQGGLLPKIPNYYSVSNSEDMRFLGNNPNKTPSASNQIVMRTDLPVDDKEYFEKFIDKKVVDQADAVDILKIQLGMLTSILEKPHIIYQHGEEDHNNMKELKEVKINDYTRTQQNQSRLQELLQSLQEEQVHLDEQRIQIQKQREVLQYFFNQVNKVEEKTGKDLKKYIKGITGKHEEKFEGLDSKITGELKNWLVSVDDKQQIMERLNSIAESLMQTENQIGRKTDQIRQNHLKLNAIEREIQASGFFRATKRRQLNADEEELLFRLAKTEYNDLYYQVAPEGVFSVHTSREVDIEVRGYKIKLLHNPNFSSNNINASDISDMKRTNALLNKNRNIYGGITGEVPDIILSAHGVGGFRFQPQPKQSEAMSTTDYRETPDICMNIKLPTFQSFRNLKDLIAKGLKNYHTKRCAKGVYASGAVIHTINKDDVTSLEFVDTGWLIHIGEIVSEIDYLGYNLKSTKDADKKAKIQEGITTLSQKLEEEYAKHKELRKLELSGDQHVGCPNEPGRPSNYSFISASQKYQQEHGLPDCVIASEMLHGNLHIFGSNEQYFPMTPRERELAEERILSSKLSSEEKIAELRKLMGEVQAGIPITNDSVAKKEIKLRIIPYLHEVVRNGGHFIIASGNHYNQSNRGSDEALEVISLFDEDCANSGRLHPLTGLGDKYGSGVLELDKGIRLYITHKMESKIDDIYGMMDQAVKMNNNANIIISFDRHHCGGGFADGSAFALGPGMQPWNKYVDTIGKYPGLRGVMNLYYSKSAPYYKWELVLDPTLERLMKN